MFVMFLFLLLFCFRFSLSIVLVYFTNCYIVSDSMVFSSFSDRNGYYITLTLEVDRQFATLASAKIRTRKESRGKKKQKNTE